MSLEKLMDELMKLSGDYLDKFTTDEIIAIREKRISENEFLSSPPDVKEIVLGFFDIIIEASIGRPLDAKKLKSKNKMLKKENVKSKITMAHISKQMDPVINTFI